MCYHLVHLSLEIERGNVTFGQVTRSKAHCSKIGREVVAMAREVCGGNGILLENNVIKAMLDMEANHTYEGTYDVNTLVSARELTGGIAAFK
jgi:alkylation response protein AidB-like acyl-CoA dehydrogenase